MNRLKSFLKAIWGNIWPTAKQKEPTEFPPQEELNSKLDDDLAWLDSMAGAYVSWEKNRYEVWREEGMFYIAIPNKETGSVFCSTSAGGVLNMARETLKKHRENILKCTNSIRHPKDFREHPWEQSYIVPASMMLYDDLIYMKGDVISYAQLSKIIKPEMLDEYAKAWRYKLPELTIEPCSEQSVILPKMDEIANSPRIYSWEDFLSLRQFAEAPYDTYISDMERARRRRNDILNYPPKSMYDDLGIKHPLDNEHK